jgi:enoyl-CoA hydratase/carnithine racemase
MSDHLLVDRDAHVAHVTLHRPDRLNALTADLMEDLRHLWGELSADPELRCVTLTGAGRGFCAGADMELLASDRADARAGAEDELSFLPGRRLPCPVVVAVNGVCAGGGLHFLADADIAIAARGASFLDPHVSVGQVTALEPLTLLGRMRSDAVRRMALLGSSERLDAEAALSAGLVSEVVDDDRLASRLGELATNIAANSPTAICRSRAILRAAEERGVAADLEEGWAAIRDHWEHPDAIEGPAAFADRRTPVWAARTAVP